MKFRTLAASIGESGWFQAGVWAMALSLSWYAFALMRETTQIDRLSTGLQLPNFELASTPLTAEDYQAVRTRVGEGSADTPVKISVVDGGLTVKAPKVGDYQAWRLAMADVMLAMPNATWSVASMCAGEACTDGAYSAQMSGVIRGFSLRGATPMPTR